MSEHDTFSKVSALVYFLYKAAHREFLRHGCHLKCVSTVPNSSHLKRGERVAGRVRKKEKEDLFICNHTIEGPRAPDLFICNHTIEGPRAPAGAETDR
jgi:hypothetical protein